MSENVSAKEAIESVLAHRVMNEPGFLEHLVLDPDGAAKPVITELLADDGAMDLSGINIAVHLETEGTLHLVVPIAKEEPELAEVSGFSFKGASFSQSMRGLKIGPPVMRAEAGSHTDAYLCTSSGVCVCTGPDECGDDVMVKGF